MQTGDTIVAIASPPGRSTRGIVRISGPNASAHVSSILVQADRDDEALSTRGIVRARLTLGVPCFVLCSPGTRSYTGEEVYEIVCVGQPVILHRVVSALLQAGARQAEPGEFTARAYFHGRVSLTEAESIAQSISAESDAQLRAAHMLSEGALNDMAVASTGDITRALGLVEAGIDFSDEEDVVAITRRELLELIERVSQSIDDVLSRSVGMERLHAVPRVVICGPTNAGKSTLFNVLLGRERAVVSRISGTTRDVLTEPMHLDPSDPFSPEIALIDLAGFDPQSDALSLQMQEAARSAVANADLILLARSVNAPRDGRHEWQELLPAGIRVIHVCSKCDLDQSTADESAADSNAALRVSAHSGAGLAELRLLLRQQLGEAGGSLAADAVALGPRHEQALRRTLDGLFEVAETLRAQSLDQRHVGDPELIAAGLRNVLDAIGSVTGRVSPDDVLDHVFATFCIGK